MIHISPTVTLPSSELSFSFSRSSGPGGQNVNKVNSKVTLRWDVKSSPSISAEVRRRFLLKFIGRINEKGELVLTCDAHREQRRNIEEVCERVRKMLRSVLQPPKKRKRTKPSKAKKEQRIRDKKFKGAKKLMRKNRIDRE